MIPTLRPYQLDTIERTFEAAMGGARIIVVQAPTGAGKSTIGCGLVRRAVNKEKRVLFVVHRRRLVDQFSQRLLEFQTQHALFMRGERYDPSYRVQVASRDTLLSRCVRNEWIDMPQADLVIVDEGRHAASDEMRRLLAPYEQRGAYIVLLDATPVLPNGQGLGPWAQAMVVAAKVSDLVRDGYLVPVKCFAPDRERVRGKTRRGVAGDLVQSWLSYAENMPTVLFCSRRQRSLDCVAAYNAAGIPAVHVDCDTPDAERDRVFDGLADGTVKVVSNVGIIREGVDIPALGCCQFYMEPPGRVGFLQACGRIMRPDPGKKHGVVIDHGGAIFRYGFPDEDTEWLLDGNVNEHFTNQRKAGLGEAVLYCAKCQMVFHGTPACPECGHMPQKPPRSVFAPPEMPHRSELLREADRDGIDTTAWEREQRVKHWLRCVAAAKNKNGSFGMAAQIYRRRYGRSPDDDFPCMPARDQWKLKVTDLYPGFGKRRDSA